MPAGQTPGVLQTLFDSEGPVWLREMTVSSGVRTEPVQ
ncbi:K88 minor fimbrial subunit faeI [Salmonella enterica subsp. enterica]|nr:K88 minor fimbrial subunit faeI [Salmonella enterica subsp. enterica]